ncbi:hypothetical protein SD074_25630 [Prolixibacter sp. SD074]|nr:hypothetical protein SD074_25630 [Prolixibacter sp. SD074]
MLSAKVPGMFVTQRGYSGFGVASGSAGQITIRGVGLNGATSEVLVMIDGQPQMMGLMGHPFPDSYVSSDLEKVEVIRGPGSLLYGTNAMGGVVNLITRKEDKDGFSGQVRGQYGSFNTIKTAGSAGYRENGFNLFASYNYDSTNGSRENSDFQNHTAYLKTGYQPTVVFILSQGEKPCRQPFSCFPGAGNLADSRFHAFPGRETLPTAVFILSRGEKPCRQPFSCFPGAGNLADKYFLVLYWEPCKKQSKPPL